MRCKEMLAPAPRAPAPLAAAILAAAALAGGCASAPNPRLARAEIAAALAEGDYTAAEQAAWKAEQALPLDPIVCLLAAEAHRSAGYPEPALACLARLLAVEAADVEVRRTALLNRAALRMELGQPQEALADLEAARELGAGGPDLQRDLGAAAYAAGDFAAARDAWSQLSEAERREIEAIVGPAFFLDLVTAGN